MLHSSRFKYTDSKCRANGEKKLVKRGLTGQFSHIKGQHSSLKRIGFHSFIFHSHVQCINFHSNFSFCFHFIWVFSVLLWIINNPFSHARLMITSFSPMDSIYPLFLSCSYSTNRTKLLRPHGKKRARAIVLCYQISNIKYQMKLHSSVGCNRYLLEQS